MDDKSKKPEKPKDEVSMEETVVEEPKEEVVEAVEAPVHVDNMPEPVAEPLPVVEDEETTPKGDFSGVAEGGVVFTAKGQFIKRNGELVKR